MPQAELTTRIKVLATIGVMLALLLAALDQTIVGTALPRIVAELNVSIATRGSSPATSSPRRWWCRSPANSATCSAASPS